MPVGERSVRRAAKKAAELKAGKTVESEKIAESSEGIRSMRDDSLIVNKSAQLGKNERIEVLQEMPVYLL